MKNSNIPIERHEDVTLYGKKINNWGKLGQFTVYSDRHGTSGPYATTKRPKTGLRPSPSQFAPAILRTASGKLSKTF